MLKQAVFNFPKFLVYKFNKKILPLKVVYITTHSCNSRCRYCEYWRAAPRTKAPKLSEVKKKILELRKKGAISINFTGGEPLLVKNIDKIIEYSKKLGMHTSINTNGKLLKSHVKTLKNLDLVTLSIDSYDRKMNEFTRGEGSYESTLKAVELLKNRNVPVTCFCVLHSKNSDIRHMEKLVLFAKEKGFGMIFQPITGGYFYKSPLEGLELSGKNVDRAVNNIAIIKRKYPKIVMNSRASIKSMLAKKFKCYAGKYIVFLSPELDLFPCMMKRSINLKDKAFGPLNCFCMSYCMHEYNPVFSFNLTHALKLLITFSRK